MDGSTLCFQLIFLNRKCSTRCFLKGMQHCASAPHVIVTQPTSIFANTTFFIRCISHLVFLFIHQSFRKRGFAARSFLLRYTGGALRCVTNDGLYSTVLLMIQYDTTDSSSTSRPTFIFYRTPYNTQNANSSQQTANEMGNSSTRQHFFASSQNVIHTTPDFL